jgi:uncharacterized protein (UPF0262 family)
MAEAGPTRRIVSIHLEDAAALRQSAEAEQERAVAIFDLIEENEFAPLDRASRSLPFDPGGGGQQARV